MSKQRCQSAPANLDAFKRRRKVAPVAKATEQKQQQYHQASNIVPELKLSVVGSGGVGKSAITMQFIQKVFIEDYDPTIEDSYSTYLPLGRSKYMLNILDTAGQEEYISLRDHQYRSGEGFLLVYSIDEEKTFREVECFHDQILRVKDVSHVPAVLIGNKCDLGDDRRVISRDDGQKLADRFGIPFFETSAKSRTNIDQVFASVTKQIISERIAASPPSLTPSSTSRRKRKTRVSCTMM